MSVTRRATPRGPAGRMQRRRALGSLLLLSTLLISACSGKDTNGTGSANQAGQGGQPDSNASNGGRIDAAGHGTSGSANGDGGATNLAGAAGSVSENAAAGALGMAGSLGLAGSLGTGGAPEAGAPGVGGSPAVAGAAGINGYSAAGGLDAVAGSVATGGRAESTSGTAGVAGTPQGPLPLRGKPCAGYTLLGRIQTSTGGKFPARLIDMEGNVVHTWTIGGFPPKMLPGGSLIGCDGVIGTYDCVEMQQITWDGELEWSFSNWVSPFGSPVSRQNHDLQRQGNPVGFYAPGQSFVAEGTTLVLAHVGRQMPEIRDQLLLDDVIYEVDWDGNLTDGFRWYGADHIDQFGYDAAALSHIRTTSPNNNLLEWLHGNSISLVGPNHWYDEGYSEFHPDNIIYSSRDSSFVIIISRQTGDVVWRIGPSFAGRPEERLGQFAGQHNPHLIPKNLPGAGNFLVFDNGGASGYGGTSTTGVPSRYSRDYSRVLEFDPVTFEIVWQYGGATGPQNFYSELISNAQRLPNGNTLITIGQRGRIIEVTPGKQIVWEYQQPADTSGGNASLYRAYRVPPEWLPPGENAALGAYATWASLFER